MFVTAGTDEHAGLLGELADSLAALGIPGRVDGDVLDVDGHRLVPYLIARAHPTPADLGLLVADATGLRPALVIADRLSTASRDVLRRAGWGWYDRRGHVRIWTPGLRIESALPQAAVRGDLSGRRAPGGNAWTTVGLEVALAALCEPEAPVTARRVAPIIDRSVGATHELIARFVDLGLVGRSTHLPLLPDLFWETSAQWPDEGWIGLSVPIEAVAERVGAADLVRVDERAATLGGARIAAVGDLPARCYVMSPAALRRARGLDDPDRPRKCWVRRAPTAWIPHNADHPADAEHPWSIAHPVVCALRLAADPARGREIVVSWGVVPGLS